MATRSRIAIELENGRVESIYCHWDGYVEHNGRILQEHYRDREKVKALIDLGDISQLHPEVVPTGRHSFDDPQKGVVVAYGRDRGETGIDKATHESTKDFFDSDIEEWGYLFTQEGEWLVKSTYSSVAKEPIALIDALSKVNA